MDFPRKGSKRKWKRRKMILGFAVKSIFSGEISLCRKQGGFKDFIGKVVQRKKGDKSFISHRVKTFYTELFRIV